MRHAGSAPASAPVALCGGTAAACAALAAWLAWHHPLSPALALGACAGLAALVFARPLQWPLWLLPLLPLVGLMPWSGWLVVEEFDLAVLAVAAGGYLRWMFGWPALRAPSSRRSLWAALWWLLPLALSSLIALQRGLTDAGGLQASALQWGWWQGYREPLNSVRLVKPVLEVLLLLPLWHAARRSDDAAVSTCLQTAMALLLGVAALAVLWERLAFTGLMDFSSDYRATGPFWEMHVGGAALDAVLALSMPVAAAAWLAARSPGRWALAGGALALGLYAALVTFSRVVYVAVPLGLALWFALRLLNRSGKTPVSRGSPVDLQARRPGPGAHNDGSAGSLVLQGCALAVFAGLAVYTFPASGYRGLLALLGAVALLLPLQAALQSLRLRGWLLGGALGAAAAGAVLVAGAWVPKAAYVAYALAWLGAAALLARWRAGPGDGFAQGHGSLTPPLALAAFIAVAAGLVAVGTYWGGAAATAASSVTAGVLLAAAAALARPRAARWPRSLRSQAQLLSAMAAVAAVVAVFDAGAYMGDRVATATQDGQGRRAHWQQALSLLSRADWMFGKGLGRYPANQALSGRAEDQTGDYRLQPPTLSEPAPSVVLTSGKHTLGWGEIFRFSQRMRLQQAGPHTLRLEVRTPTAAALHVEVCEKHLLYNAACLLGSRTVAAQPVRWQAVEIMLKSESAQPPPWHPLRMQVFSIGLESGAARVELRRLSLLDAQGGDHLANGTFDAGLARWFFSSDRYHLPWHAKNLAVHLVFEQGLFGLSAFTLAMVGALWRVSAGAARQHTLAPALAGALVGLLTVGLVDSLLDMPRVAFLALWLMAVALALPARQARSGRVDEADRASPGSIPGGGP